MGKQADSDGGNKRRSAAPAPRQGTAGRTAGKTAGTPAGRAGAKSATGRAPSRAAAPKAAPKPAPRSAARTGAGAKAAAKTAPRTTARAGTGVPRPAAQRPAATRRPPGQASVRTLTSTSTARKGPRPVSKAIYRRRRLVLGIFALLVVGALGAAGMTLTSTFMEASALRDPLPSAGPSSSSGASDAASPKASAAVVPPTSAPAGCNQSLVTVSASLDKASYAPEELPVMSLKVTNGGTVACDVNVGTSQMDYVLTSGNDRIFSSRDCQEGGTDLVKSIAPGASETANFTWQRKRSAPGCGHIDAVPGGGGAYYVLKVSLGSRTSAEAPFQLQ
ncbi:hypothetical protein ACQCSX_15315 [Pseudarthrobacter sp. P1]|uniref:hypothetical protein n=1 Tax=Pseudarthrobacter sp. P1 TaxID=3418418 RepID=UPI003CEB1651